MNKTKLSETQKKLLEEIKKDIETITAYKDFDDYVMNCKQPRCFSSRYHMNGAYQTLEAIRTLPYYEKDVKDFANFKANNRTLVYAKTETVKCLERKGYIKIIEFRNGFELVELLNK